MSSTFEIVDRRKSKEVEAAPVVVEPVPTGDHKWEDVAFILALAQGQGGMVFLGRAVGLRDDGKTFAADYLLLPKWKEGFQWEPHARKRLDTFLNCECSRGAACAVHKMYIPQWQKADNERMILMGREPVSPAIEAVVRAEQAAQSSKIVVPRG